MAKTYEQWVVALARWITDRPWTTMLLVVASTFAVASGVRHIGFDTDYRVFFGPDNPQLLAWDEVQNVYTKNDNIIFMVEPPGETVFTKNTLSLVEELTEAAWTLPFALRVDSLTNYQHTEANGDDLTVAWWTMPANWTRRGCNASSRSPPTSPCWCASWYHPAAT